MNLAPFTSGARPFDHAALLECIEEMRQAFPNLSFDYLGNSILGRGIPILSLGHGRRRLLYIGAHHGMESITSLILVQFLDDLLTEISAERAPCGLSARLFCEVCTLHVIPMLNPDGVDYQIHGVDERNPLRERLIASNGGEDFSRWQANARGVDLNHNYDADFWRYKRLAAQNGIDSAAATRYAGERPESEPEVASLCNFIRYHAPISGLLTLHTQGEEILIGQAASPRTKAVASRFAALCGYSLKNTEGLASMSGLSDWCATCQIPALTLECGRGVNPLPPTDATAIYRTLRHALLRCPTLV